MTVHGDGVVHIRENNTNKDLDSFRVPPLRDFAAAAYWLHVFPGPLANYREDNIPQPGDLEIHIGEAEGKVHQVLVAVAVGHDPSLRTRVALPGLVPDAKERALKHFPKDDADLVVQAVLVWLPNEVGLPPERETWALVRLPDGGNYLPRPLGGTGEPTVWDPLLKELRAAGMKGP